MSGNPIPTPETPVLDAGENLVLCPSELDDAESYLQLVSENYERLSKWIRVPKPPDTVEDRRKAQAADLANGEGGKGRW
jgi:hypothetical protein